MMKKLLFGMPIIVFCEIISAPCTLGPNGINQWRLIYQVGQCVNTSTDILCSKLERIGSSIDCTGFTKLDPILSILESCDTCSAFDIVTSQLETIESKIDIISISLFDGIYNLSTTIESVTEKIFDTVTMIDSIVDILASKVDNLNSKLDVCDTCSVIGAISTNLDICCSMLDSELRSIGDVLSTKSDGCCSVLDQEIRSVSDVLGAKIDVVKSDVDSVSTKVDGVNAQIVSCCNTLSTLDVLIKSDVDSVSTKVDGVNAQIVSCCNTLSTLDVLIKSDVDSVSTKVDSVSSKIDSLSSKSDACCATLSAFDVLIKSDVDVLSSKVMVIDSVLDIIANQQQGFVSCFGDSVAVGRDEQIALNFQYGASTYDTTTTTVNTGSVATTNRLITLSSGASATGAVSVQSKRRLNYRPGHDAFGFFTAGFFDGGRVNSTQWIGLFDASDGMAVGYNGAAFSILFRQNGANITVAQASFNVDTLNGSGPSGITIDPTKLNLFRIAYGWLGVTTIRYQISDANCNWYTFHEIPWTNLNTTPHVFNPRLPMRAEVTNTGNTATIRLGTGSWNAGIIGDYSHVGNRVFSVSNALVGKNVGTTEIPIISIQNNTTFNALVNTVEARMYAIGAGDIGNATTRITFNVYKNATLTGAVFNPVSAGQSCMSVDTAATVFALGAGQFLMTMMQLNAANGPGTNFLSDENFDILLYPGDMLTITGSTLNGAGGSNVRGYLAWQERF